ncbi:MAG: proline--tRNA ligase, partial [Anaerolineales bacterium]
HEEIVADLVRKTVQSYRQLPMLVYHIQTKWRDDPRPRAGLIRVREFTMKDSYSLDADDAGLDKQYRAHYQAYFNIFNRCGLPVISVLSDVGMMGGSMAHEYMYLTPIGEDTLLLCDSCGYKANRQIALFEKKVGENEELLPTEEVYTPNVATIENLANFLNVPKSKTAKAVFLVGTFTKDQEDIEQMIFAVVRGDMELNETKLANAVKAKELRPAQEEEIEAVGAVAGFASPIGIKDVIVVVDDLIPHSSNLVAGANKKDTHFKNVNYGRDFQASIVADIVAAEDGYACVRCGSELHEARGVEVGNIFKLGTKYTEALGATFLDKDGKAQPVIMGSYGIGSGRLLACIAEEYNDEGGLMWPISTAPYHVHLVSLRGVEEEAEKIYQEISDAGLEVLFDDRKESPGVKFNDADLIGIPIRITVGSRSLSKGMVEIKIRNQADRVQVPLDSLIDEVLAMKKSLEKEIQDMVIEVPFEAE